MRISSVIMFIIILLILFGFISYYALDSYSTILELNKRINDLNKRNDELSMEITKASEQIMEMENTLRDQKNAIVLLQEKEKVKNLENQNLTQQLEICQSSQKNFPLALSLSEENNTYPMINQEGISGILVLGVTSVFFITTTLFNHNRLCKLRIHLERRKTYFLGTDRMGLDCKGTYLFLSPQEMSWLIQNRRMKVNDTHMRTSFVASNPVSGNK
jgi:hypothetical protein